MFKQIFATKNLQSLTHASAEENTGFARTLGLYDLISLGVGAIVGTGVFVLTGQAAASHAGPAVTIAYAISGASAALAGLCYAEMASMMPVSGSAYTYAYATLGEFVAFLLGWTSFLQYTLAAAAVSVGWSGYMQILMQHVAGISYPKDWVSTPLAWDMLSHSIQPTGAYINLPAMLILALVTCIVVYGVQASMKLTSWMVVIKLLVIVLFVLTAAPVIDPANWQPFVPPNTGVFGHFGVSGILQASTMLFFAYGGFDTICTAAQECRNPQRDLPIGIVVSLGLVTLLYLLVSLVLTGVVSYTQLDVAYPIALGIKATGYSWLEIVVDAGALAGLTSVLLALIYGQSRVLFAMAADGLLPQSLCYLNKRFGTPVFTTVLVGFLAAVGGGLLPIDILSELTSVATLFAFVVVSLGVIVLRLRQPNTPRLFKVPGSPFGLPLMAVIVFLMLMYTASTATLWRFVVWILLGVLIYFVYSRHHALLRQK